MNFEKLQSLKILYVEDEEIVQRAIGGMLSDIVSEVVLANDGLEALKMMKEHKFDLIITDIQMPNLNGAQMAQQIRASGDTTPIIAITAFDNSTPILDKYTIKDDIGIDKYIQKPADIDDIINVILELV